MLKSKKFKKLLPIALLALIIVIVSSLALTKNSEDSPIPNEIMNKINFLVYYPNNEQTWTTDESKTEFDTESGVLLLNSNDQTATIILSQQSSPEVFNDVPDQYQRMLNTLNQYAEISTSFGTITLTKPAELKGGQSAVGNLNGTLLFAKPDRDLSMQEWENFFKSMEVIR